MRLRLSEKIYRIQINKQKGGVMFYKLNKQSHIWVRLAKLKKAKANNSFMALSIKQNATLFQKESQK